MATAKKKTGRPTLYSEALAAKICDLIEQGYSERQIGEMDGMPTRRTIQSWKDKNVDFLLRSARARQASAERFREEALQVARDTAALADRIAESDPSDPLVLLNFPKGYVDAKKLLVQELNREAAIRDDSRFGDRKLVDVTGTVEIGQGMDAFYRTVIEELANDKEPVS
ncbi:hypothetical protein [Sutterella wadsworthensis]|uniref:terminase small subunit-like protein n=1 Tax=Sutterella wadsworthensis TaxID=40545 RepID=UPI003AF095B0